MLQSEQDVVDLLEAQGIPYELDHHPAIFTSAEGDALDLPHPDRFVKNLYLRDDKKRHRYLVVVRHDTRIDLKALAALIDSRRLSFASEEDLGQVLHITRGSVTPFALLNDEERAVNVVFDDRFATGLIGVHPMVNTATVYVPADALIALIKEHGNPFMLADFTQMSE